MTWHINPALLASLTFRINSDGAYEVRAHETHSFRLAGPEEVVRQLFVAELIGKLRYSPQSIHFECPIQMGSARKRADLAVRSTDGKIEFLVETKVHATEMAIAQLKSYMAASGATYGALIALDARQFLQRTPDSRFQFITPASPPSAEVIFGTVSQGKVTDDADVAPQDAPNSSVAFTTGKELLSSARQDLGIKGLERVSQTVSVLTVQGNRLEINNSELAEYRTIRKRALSVGCVWPPRFPTDLWGSLVFDLFETVDRPEVGHVPSMSDQAEAVSVLAFLKSSAKRLRDVFPGFPDGWVRSSELFAAYKDSHGSLAMTPKAFSMHVKKHCRRSHRSSGSHYFLPDLVEDPSVVGDDTT